MNCPKCSQENPDTFNFCRVCGAKLGLKCPACNAAVLPTDNFCGNCGRDLQKVKEGELIVASHAVSPIISSSSGHKRMESFTNSIGQQFVLIPAGEFIMGSPKGEKDHLDNEIQHEVALSKPFFIQVALVTQGQWQSVMGDNPSEFKGDDGCPVESVSWNDVQEFIRKLNAREGTDKYRLPTEAEWEYACRAGSVSAWCFGGDEDLLGEYAWYFNNAVGKTHPAASKKPNAWGLFDMHGNVWEWCRDWRGAYTPDAVTDPGGPASGGARVIRGGAWSHGAQDSRSANRGGSNPDRGGANVGFRLVRNK